MRTAQNSQQTETSEEPLSIPRWMGKTGDASPIVFVENDGRDLGNPDAETAESVNAAISAALQCVCPSQDGHSGLIKVHIGERKCHTRMRPEYAGGANKFLRKKGFETVVAGDTTVAYTGPRGHQNNPPGDVEKYQKLASQQGWTSDGPAGVDFVVLDRPDTVDHDHLAFDNQYREKVVKNDGAFHDFHPAGGYLAADCMVNYAHLTLHGLAGVAGCVKSVAMGCAALPGKLRMHQSLRPVFDEELCISCGLCVENCPEDALWIPEEGSIPEVDAEACIGCGECEAVCAPRNGAVTLQGHEIDDWSRGQQTLPVRMGDYVIGLMNGRWDRDVHVLHMYSVTERCDCLNISQEPMVERDIGFLVGRNPFAIDRLGGELLSEALENKGYDPGQHLLETAEQVAGHVEETYGIRTEAPVQRIQL